MILITLLVVSLIIMGMGYGFKKSWLMWLAVPFWLMAGIYMGFYQFWFPAAAQHSLILVGLIGTVGCILSATRMQLKTLTSEGTDDTGEESDEDLKEYQNDYKKYQAESNMYKTKKIKRKSRYSY